MSTKEPRRSLSSKIKWTSYGAAFGLTFPVIAMVVQPNQLFWIIMTAPFFLGAFAYIAGRENDRVRLLHKNLQISNIQASKMAALGEMAGGIAHEINNPLSIISGKAFILRGRLEEAFAKQDCVHEQIFNDIDRIESTVGRISKIIKGLQSFSRNAEKDEMLKIQVFQVIEDTLELCREKFGARSIELKLEFDKKSDVRIEGRSAQISQVLLNLLNNSLDAIESLSEKWIELRVEFLKAGIKISVTDCGNGIPKDVLAKMMQPFFTTKDVGKGTGLGLSISKGIIESHHGKLYYDENSMHTRFVIELPYIQPKIKQAA